MAKIENYGNKPFREDLPLIPVKLKVDFRRFFNVHTDGFYTGIKKYKDYFRHKDKSWANMTDVLYKLGQNNHLPNQAYYAILKYEPAYYSLEEVKKLYKIDKDISFYTKRLPYLHHSWVIINKYGVEVMQIPNGHPLVLKDSCFVISANKIYNIKTKECLGMFNTFFETSANIFVQLVNQDDRVTQLAVLVLNKKTGSFTKYS
jgi:hypothetical protein